MTRFLTHPIVAPIAWTVVSGFDLGGWAAEHGLTDTINDPETPLGQLAMNVSVSEARKSCDALTEFAGRHCYRSWRQGRTSAEYIENILRQGHGSVLEHSSLSVAVSGISRSCSHELVRHRAGMAWSQESQRYVEAGDIDFVVPPAILDEGLDSPAFYGFKNTCEAALAVYRVLVRELERTKCSRKQALEAARSVLPNAAETRLVMTANLRAWRHFLTMRGSDGADAEIRRLAKAIAMQIEPLAPLVLGDLQERDGEIVCEYWKV